MATTIAMVTATATTMELRTLTRLRALTHRDS
jgi:hypothetical protein